MQHERGSKNEGAEQSVSHRPYLRQTSNQINSPAKGLCGAVPRTQQFGIGRGRADSTLTPRKSSPYQRELPDFSQIRAQGAGCSLFAFDLLFLDGTDLRRLPLADRKARLKALVRRKKSISYVDHLEGDGGTIFEHARRLGLEGIVSKRRDLPYCSGRSAAWLKIRNPDYERGGLAFLGGDSCVRGGWLRSRMTLMDAAHHPLM